MTTSSQKHKPCLIKQRSAVLLKQSEDSRIVRVTSLEVLEKLDSNFMTSDFSQSSIPPAGFLEAGQVCVVMEEVADQEQDLGYQILVVAWLTSYTGKNQALQMVNQLSRL